MSKSIEVELNNKQVFLVLFSLILLGCLLFYTGVMVGRSNNANNDSDNKCLEQVAVAEKLAHVDQAEKEHEKVVQKVEEKKGKALKAQEKTQEQQDDDTNINAEGATEKKAVVEQNLAQNLEKIEKKELKQVQEQAILKMSKENTFETKDSKKDFQKKKVSQKQRFVLQLGAFRERSIAESFIREKGLSLFNPYVSEGGNWFRVRLGNFVSKEEAEKYRGQFIKEKNLPVLVVKEEN